MGIGILKKDVISFINDFKKFNPIDIEKTFKNGYCYWFAHILKNRFYDINFPTEIYYNDIENHFICRVGKRFYDIEGEVKNIDNYVPWDVYKTVEYCNAMVVYRDCILKISTKENINN